MIDMSKLTPMPWFLDIDGELCYGDPSDPTEQFSIFEHGNRPDMEAMATARHALDVMMRRGWHAELAHRPDKRGKWIVYFDAGSYQGLPRTEEELFFDDPFTALVEADRWMKEQEKSNA